MGSGPLMYFSIKMSVADYKSDQIHHLSTFEKAFTERCNHYELFEGVEKVLNLDKFAQSPEFAELIFTLGNKSSLTLLCSTLTKHCDIFKMVNGIRLSNNQISDLSPFEMLPAIDIVMIDLRNNKITDVSQLKHLKKMNLTEMFIANNPITQTDGFMAQIQETLPNIVKVDGVYTRNVLPSLRHLGSGINVIEVIFQGDTIQSAESLPPHIFLKYKTSDMWHQVIINHNGKYGKTDLLMAIFTLLLSHEFYPCHYQIGDKCDSFFIRNCFEQMEFLYMEKLRVPIPCTNDSVTLTYKMNVANFKKEQIDPPECITKAIEASFYLKDKCLNLERFSDRPELNHIELILAAPRTMMHILLKGARSFMTNIEKVVLRDNDLDSSKGMGPLTWMKSLNSIDLSKNKIENIADLEKFPKVGVITSIKLHDNPLCAKYKSPIEYISAVKKLFPDIQTLDGRQLSPDRCCVAQKNYLCSLDTYDLTAQFIRHYFNVYDSNTRGTLSGLYSAKAILSISSNLSGIAGKASNNRLQVYQSKSRNILRMPKAALTKSIIYGSDKIKELWKDWPATQHDFQSFTIDVTYNSPLIVVLTVSGVFKEQGSTLNEEDVLLGFTRTFVLKRVAEGAGFFGHSVQYSIINEMLFIHRPSVYQTKNSFRRVDNMLMDTDDVSTAIDRLLPGLNILN
ncbi:hypothetical protein HA402_000400 [Bradysia odoriphaga]|nr:hypothetical protein HA402_000400 [Bradysia odoriphaga]